MFTFSMFGTLKMGLLYLLGVTVGLPNFGVSGRAMNISNAWFLPQEGFPVFYRYFGDKVTWIEAEAVCDLHQGDLLSVQTGEQMDAVRAYLKEIDVADNIWIGLQKESPDKPFSWTNDEKLLGDGYWAEPIPKTEERLCAAIDPAADYRWNSYYCRGPQVASFVCELPVPEWAKEENGCLITSLPSLTVTLVPEAGVIQLMSDCGLDGTRTIACNSEMNREEIIKRLSCDVDAFASTVFGRSTTTDAAKDIVIHHSSPSESNNSADLRETAKTFSPQTRHRRYANLSSAVTAKVPVQEGSTPASKSRRVTSAAFLNIPSHTFPHSPYLASVRNAPATEKPRMVKNGRQAAPTSTIGPSDGTSPPQEDLPVLIITGEKLNESASATSENPQIVLMIENEDLGEPFLVPLSDDLNLNDPSASPVEVINVDLVEADNLTLNGTANGIVPSVPPARLSLAVADMALSAPSTLQSNARQESSNAVEEEKGPDVPQRPNRGRLLTHSTHPSFYPRFLNRVLG